MDLIIKIDDSRRPVSESATQARPEKTEYNLPKGLTHNIERLGYELQPIQIGGVGNERQKWYRVIVPNRQAGSHLAHILRSEPGVLAAYVKSDEEAP